MTNGSLRSASEFLDEHQERFNRWCTELGQRLLPQCGSLMTSPMPSLPMMGVEIESEGIRDTLTPLSSFWHLKRDDSLRGDYRYEYVSQPSTPAQLAYGLYMYKINALQYRQPFSWRCATHIHMDLLELTLPEISALGLISFAADNYFYALGAEARRDNYNCRPLSMLLTTAEQLGTMCAHCEAEQPTSLKRLFTPARNGDDARYAGMNWWALGRFGTLEVRHFPGTADLRLMLSWMGVCNDIYQAACAYTFEEVLELITAGPEVFGTTIFGDHWRRMAYRGHNEDWQDMLEGLTHLLSVKEQMEHPGATLDNVLRTHRAIA
jgi:hypothetical protein